MQATHWGHTLLWRSIWNICRISKSNVVVGSKIPYAISNLPWSGNFVSNTTVVIIDNLIAVGGYVQKTLMYIENSMFNTPHRIDAREYGPPWILEPALAARAPVNGRPSISTDGKAPPYAT